MSARSLVMLSALSLSFAGCASNLAGSWDGDVDCGDVGAVPMVLDITEDGGRSYSGDGNVQGLYIGDVEAAVVFEMNIDQPRASGAQVLGLETTCALYTADASPAPMDCYAFDELGWDGQDAIEASVDDFLGTGYTCDIMLQR